MYLRGQVPLSGVRLLNCKYETGMTIRIEPCVGLPARLFEVEASVSSEE